MWDCKRILRVFFSNSFCSKQGSFPDLGPQSSGVQYRTVGLRLGRVLRSHVQMDLWLCCLIDWHCACYICPVPRTELLRPPGPHGGMGVSQPVWMQLWKHSWSLAVPSPEEGDLFQQVAEDWFTPVSKTRLGLESLYVMFHTTGWIPKSTGFKTPDPHLLSSQI